MEGDKGTITATTATVVVLVTLIGTVSYGCSEARNKYYQAQSVCVSNGGSWVSRNRDNEADCLMLHPREKKE